MSIRKIKQTLRVRDTLEGAGVRLKRGFSHAETSAFDPFLLFDDFSSKVVGDYAAGFPWHPHRGIETVTYLLDGAVRHKDSLGNEGVIGSGAVQWMTAGRGIIHEEMPESVHGIRGFQLWVNMSQADKMSAPKYVDLTDAIMPVESIAPLAHARTISTDPLYLDITIEANSEVTMLVTDGHTAFIYIIEGAVSADGSEQFYGAGTIVLFERTGSEVALRAPAAGARLLLIAGAPLNEPIAWHGPIVMNTQAELEQAFAELHEGTFIQINGISI